MTTTNNFSKTFNFRTKFKKLLKDENRTEIVSAFNRFCDLNSVEAQDVLWRMTYSQDTALEEVYKLGLNSAIIPSEDFLLFRNELRYQYESFIQDFLQYDYLKDNEETHNAFEQLKKCSDSIVASIVYDHCDTVWDNHFFERTLFLLKSEHENHYFGGIRSLGFNMEEAKYLKEFHIEIHNLLASMSEFFENDNPLYVEEEEKVIEGVVSEEKIEILEEKPAETLKKFKPVTPENLLIYKDVFDAFTHGNDMNILGDIANLGFDLNEVMAKAEKIKNFIIAAENLSWNIPSKGSRIILLPYSFK